MGDTLGERIKARREARQAATAQPTGHVDTAHLRAYIDQHVEALHDRIDKLEAKPDD